MSLLMWDVVHLWVVMAKLCVTGNVLICYNADLFSAFDNNYVLLLCVILLLILLSVADLFLVKVSIFVNMGAASPLHIKS